MLIGHDGRAVLSDFGVSRIFDEELRRELSVTVTFAADKAPIMGSFGYLAPELKRGEPATPAADAYALGVLVFRLLTGVWYEEGSDALALLAKFKLRWMAVLPQLLSPHAERRPQKLYPLKEQLKGPPITAPRPKTAPKRRKSRTNLVAALLGEKDIHAAMAGE